MPTTYKKYSEAKLRNNCPECFAKDGLRFSFANKHDENALYIQSSPEVKSTLHCTICDTVIYPARWTQDIERVHDYNRKLNKPQTFFKFKPLAAILLIAVIVVGAIAAYLFYIL